METRTNRVSAGWCGLALVLATVVVASCSLIREDEPLGLDTGGVSVHSVLVAGSDTVSVYITRVDPAFDNTSAPLGGAHVRIVNGGDTVRLSDAPEGFPRCYHHAITIHYTPAAEPDPAGPGCYAAALERPIRSGARYELVITLPDGRVVHGAAVVPEAPALLAPPVWGHYRWDSAALGSADATPIEIPVRWHAPGAGAIGVNVGVTSVFRGGARVPDGRCFVDRDWPPWLIRFEGDSLRYDIERVACVEPGDSTERVTVEWDSLQARVLVTAYDTAYARYLEFLPGGGSASPEEATAGLTGALGVFAGAAAAERPVTIVTALVDSAGARGEWANRSGAAPLTRCGQPASPGRGIMAGVECRRCETPTVPPPPAARAPIPAAVRC